ncbi:NAD(P)H-binding protein [Streptomyces sp. 4F14]|uniref:NAD(P)H-binding protein n=1 Tax=Streptomyces sp. 4F14 TaxID=3394380 RepID=UPI003A854A19
MSHVVTGASGNLGRLVVEGLLEKVPADRVTAVVRSEEKAAPFTARGVRTAIADYNAPDTFADLFSPGDQVLLISSSEMTADRVAQHRTVIDAAGAAGVALLAYTSATGGHEAPLTEAHRGTEKILAASDVPHTVLRNNWYSEIFTDRLDEVIAHGTLTRAAGDGRIASATRADYAAAAVAVLTGEGHAGRTYELGGDEAWNFTEFAAELTRRSGKRIAYRQVTPDAYADLLTATGLPALYARILADADASFARGELARTTGDLSRLTGRPTTPIAATIADALK